MNKTAMQTLIDKLDKILDSFPDEDNLPLSIRGQINAYINCKNLANEFLELEKQQIIDAYWAGINGTMNDYSEAQLEERVIKGIKIAEEAEQYYNETYKKE